MQQTQKVVVYGDPRGKGRPRFSYGSGHAYTDSATTAYEREVVRAWESAANTKFIKMPTEVIIKAYFSVPHSLSKRKKAELYGMPCLKKPDADNIAKIILDALNSAWTDDSQVDVLVVTKQYVSSEEDLPRVEVEVTGFTE